MKYTFSIDADHYQFYLEDDVPRQAYQALWSRQASLDRVDVMPGLIAIGTSRYGANIPVVVEVRAAAPDDEDLARWDHAVECAIQVESGRLVLTSPASFQRSGPSIELSPGTYRARIYYGALDRVYGNAEMDGDDHYRIALWSDSYVEPHVLKRELNV